MSEQTSAEVIATGENTDLVNLIKETIKAEIDGVHEKLEKLDTIEGLLHQIASGNTAPNAYKKADQFTFSMKPNGEYRSVGQGLLINVPDFGKETFFFLSAAHVIIHLKPKQGVEFEALDGAVHARGEFGLTMLLPESYVGEGSSDIGLIELKKFDIINKDEHDLYSEPILVSKRNACIGRIVVGKGNVLTRGSIVGKVEGDDGRVLITAASIGGSSGAPLLDNTPSLCAILHGDEKHSLHFYKVHQHSETNHSNSVYADLLDADNVQLKKIDFKDDNINVMHEVLVDIENLKPDIIDNLSSYGDVLKLKEYPREVMALGLSLMELKKDDKMKVAFLDDGKKFDIETFISKTKTLIFSHDQKNKIFYKLVDENSKITCWAIKNKSSETTTTKVLASGENVQPKENV